MNQFENSSPLSTIGNSLGLMLPKYISITLCQHMIPQESALIKQLIAGSISFFPLFRIPGPLSCEVSAAVNIEFLNILVSSEVTSIVPGAVTAVLWSPHSISAAMALMPMEVPFTGGRSELASSLHLFS